MAIEPHGAPAAPPPLSAEARAILDSRCERFVPLAREALAALYGDTHDVEAVLDRCLEIAHKAYAARPEALRRRDRARLHAPDWYQQPEMVGYSTYVDRFAGDIAGLAERLDYLAELGVTYLHLLPITRPRPGASDGGYAVEAFDAVDPRLGDMAALERLTAACRERNIAVATDLVLNHTADTHPWARRACGGDTAYRGYYHVFTDRAEVERLRAALPEIFPRTAPGNFTRVEALGGWVWTTFYPFQWDLNYANPAVFAEMLAVMLNFANRGIDVLRLDSAPFLWKRAGTDCRNLPEVHAILRAFHALTRIAAPALALKAEAVVTPEHQTAYLGEGAHAGRECQLAYHNTLMVLLWSALAAGHAERLTDTLRRMPVPPTNTAWITYIRCHDDIGWGILDSAGEGRAAAKDVEWLSDFYAGRVPGSFARGRAFEADPGRPHGTAGTTASLAGLEAALESGEAEAVDLAIRRILLLHSVILAFGGIPLLYMGDEIGLTNDYAHAAAPDRADDARWLHRPAMDWQAAARRADETTIEGRLWNSLQRMISVRAASPALHADTPSRALHCANRHIFVMRRAGARGRLLLLANFSGESQTLKFAEIERARFALPLRDRLTGRRFEPGADLVLAPYESLWLEPV